MRRQTPRLQALCDMEGRPWGSHALVLHPGDPVPTSTPVGQVVVFHCYHRGLRGWWHRLRAEREPWVERAERAP